MNDGVGTAWQPLGRPPPRLADLLRAGACERRSDPAPTRRPMAGEAEVTIAEKMGRGRGGTIV